MEAGFLCATQTVKDGDISWIFNYNNLVENTSIILFKSVAVSKLQVAIIPRSSREMSQTVHID